MVDAATPSVNATEAPRRCRGRPVLYALGGLVLFLVLLICLALWWTSSQGSLRQALSLAQRFLPAGQSLQFEGVAGSISRGGSIGMLRWSSAGTTVTVEELDLEWRLREIF